MTEYTYIDHNTPPDIPEKLAKCPICRAKLLIDGIEEWDDNGRVPEEGLHINCSTQPDYGSDEFDDWFNWHWSTPYIDWLPVQRLVWVWFDARYRIADDKYTNMGKEKLRMIWVK